MARTFEKYLVTIMVFLICFVISVLNSEFTAIIYPATAQTTDTENMTAADELLMKGDTTAALDQINLAEIQLSLLNMGFQETSMNQTQAMEFIIGGSLSSMRMAANCIIDSQAMVLCMQ
jgi:hypothetical protein